MHTPILSAITSLSVTVNGLARPEEGNPPGVSLPVETHNQLNEMQSVLTGLEKKIINLKVPSPPREYFALTPRWQMKLRSYQPKWTIWPWH